MALQVGDIVEGKVTGIKPFGAFVSLPEGKTGLVHISEVSYEFVQDLSARGADLLCMDSTYADDTDLPKAKLYGHATCRETGALAAEAKVRRLWLTHYSAAVTDPAPGLAAARTQYPAAAAGYDGLQLELEFDEG